MQLRRDARPAFNYAEYLASDEWKHIRELILWRDHYICQGCLSAKATEVHHADGYADVGHEWAFQLLSLCERCHRRWHKRHGRG